MAIRTILKQDDPALRKTCRPVDEVDDRIRQLAADMTETMRAAEGLGLAAPQVGILRRLIVIDVGQGPVVLANPQLVRKSGAATANEGCLSLPGIRKDISRPQRVTVSGINMEGKAVVMTGTGLFARAVCHEIDHLDGILFVDHAEAKV